MSQHVDQNFLNAKQVIFIGQKQFEFSQFDAIFTLSHSPFLEELGLTVSSTDDQTLRKKLMQIIPT
jgi:hypothetical protein